MRVTALSGGVGGGKFLAGLSRVVASAALTAIVNTGDDDRIRGLHVSADVDSVLYYLAGLADWDRGWGVQGETFVANERYAQLAARAGVAADLHEWFGLGDRDLATHLLRTRILDSGGTLAEAIAALGRAMGVGTTVLPMSDDPVRTTIETTDGRTLAFEEYFVRHRHAVDVGSVSFEGAERARPAPGVLEAISSCDVLAITPSNPILSEGPILAVPGIRDAVASRSRRVAVSPIIGGRTVKGPADAMLRSLGHEPSALGVARMYRGLVDVFVLDEADASLSPAIGELGMRPVVCDTLMRSPEDAARLTKTVLESV